MGIIKTQIDETFEKLKNGDLRGFCEGLTNFGSLALKYHKDTIQDEINAQLEKLKEEKKYNKDIIGTFKKLEMINALK